MNSRIGGQDDLASRQTGLPCSSGCDCSAGIMVESLRERTALKQGYISYNQFHQVMCGGFWKEKPELFKKERGEDKRGIKEP